MGEFNGSGSPMQVDSQNGTSTPAVVPMPFLPQAGEVFVGPGAQKEAQLIGLGLSKLSSRRKDDLAQAKRYAMDLSIKQIMLRQQKQQQENQQKQQMYAQALSLMSRVYIGSISFEVREDMLKKAFEVFGPIKSINMSWDAVTGHHKTFAFLEYEVPEAALLAQESMNGQMLGGRSLKVNSMDMRLPSNMPQAQPIIEMVQKDARKYSRVYVASVHPDLTEDDLKSVFEAFGKVMKCQLARALGGRGHRGFGYLEFDSMSSMNEAIAGMNMFDLGGQYLRVGRCITPPEALSYLQPSTSVAIPAAAAVAAAAVTAKVMAAEATTPNKSGDNSRNQSPAPEPKSGHKFDVSKVKEEIMEKLKKDDLLKEHAAHQENMDIVSENVKMEIESSPSPPPPPPPPPVSPPPPPPAPPMPPMLTVPEIKHEPTPPPLRKRGFDTPPQHAVNTPPPPGLAAFPGTGNASPNPGLYTPSVGLAQPPPIGIVAPPAVVTLPKLGAPMSITAPPPPPKIFEPPKPASLPQPTSLALPMPSASGEPVKLTSAQRKKLKKEAQAKKSFAEKMDKILNQQKHAQDVELSLPATYGAQDPNLAPKDALNNEDEEEAEMLAIMGPGRGGDNVQSLALALMDGGGALMAYNKRKLEAQKAAGGSKEPKQKRKKNVDPKKIQPKLNTAQALAAAAKAGEMSDALKSEMLGGEDASLASQEGLEIRGNDARHLLMAKLMRTNRSCILILRNMVTPDEIDEYLEEEIKDECGKFGNVVEVVIANDPNAGVVKIFVKFGDPTQVDAAKAALDGRYFGGKTVKADAYDQILYDHGDYTG